MQEVVPTFTNVSPPQRGGAAPAPLTSGGPKWLGNFPQVLVVKKDVTRE